MSGDRKIHSQPRPDPLEPSSGQGKQVATSATSQATSQAVTDEWDTVIAELGEMQAELSYEDTQQALNRFLEQLNLTARERHGLESSIGQLRQMVQRLEQAVVQIAVFGLVGRGKSSVLNALAGQPLFATGPLHGVTTEVGRSPTLVLPTPAASPNPDSGLDPDPAPASLSALEQGSGLATTRIVLPTSTAAHIELVDTPGIDEVDGGQRTRLAHEVAKHADLILFVVAGDITALELEALSELRQWSKPMLLVFNKVDQYPAVDREQLYQTIRDQRVRALMSPDEIMMTAAAPLVVKPVVQPDGSTRVTRMRGEPDVTALKLKILEVLQREGKALVALNTMLYADELNEQVVQQKTAIRDRAANDLIWNVVMVKAIAMALNPVTVLDLLSGVTIDLMLVVSLSRLYGIPLTQHRALNLLRTIALGMGGISISELLATLGLSSLKGALGAAVPITGGLSLAPYVSVAIAQAGVAGVSTYAIGQICKEYLANGATWGQHSPKATIQSILSSLDEASLLQRVKAELSDRLQRAQPPSS